jgi:hypothetical protein
VGLEQHVELIPIINALFAIAGARLLYANVQHVRDRLRYGTNRRQLGEVVVLIGINLLYAGVAAIPLRANLTQISFDRSSNVLFQLSEMLAVTVLLMVVIAVPIVCAIVILSGGPRNGERVA